MRRGASALRVAIACCVAHARAFWNPHLAANMSNAQATPLLRSGDIAPIRAALAQCGPSRGRRPPLGAGPDDAAAAAGGAPVAVGDGGVGLWSYNPSVGQGSTFVRVSAFSYCAAANASAAFAISERARRAHGAQSWVVAAAAGGATFCVRDAEDPRIVAVAGERFLAFVRGAVVGRRWSDRVLLRPLRAQAKAILLKLPDLARHEKNWLPFSVGGGARIGGLQWTSKLNFKRSHVSKKNTYTSRTWRGTITRPRMS